jgi:histidinol dehydrogenase
VAAGDYISGTNHIIPTDGNARFSSPLGVYDFLKKSSITFYDRDTLKKEKEFIETLSDFENLLAHNNSIKIRFADEPVSKAKKLKRVE